MNGKKVVLIEIQLRQIFFLFRNKGHLEARKFHPFYIKALEEINKLHFSEIFKIKSSFGNDALGGKKIFGLRLKRINHKKRIQSLNKLRKLLITEKFDFLVAHNLVLSAKVEQELGNIKGAIKKSTDSYNLFNSMHNRPRL